MSTVSVLFNSDVASYIQTDLYSYPTVEVLVLFAEYLDRLLCLLDLSANPVDFRGLVPAFLLPALDFRLLITDAPLPFFDRLVELTLSFVELRVHCLSLHINKQMKRTVTSLAALSSDSIESQYGIIDIIPDFHVKAAHAWLWNNSQVCSCPCIYTTMAV